MTRIPAGSEVCNKGVILDGQPRWCHLPTGHQGPHDTIWRLNHFTWETKGAAA